MSVLHAVILEVPSTVQKEIPKKRHAKLSQRARGAVQRSALQQGLGELALQKNADGSPRPEKNGIFWSLSHKPGYVLGLAGREPIGVDIERLRSVRPGLVKRLGEEREWDLFRERNLTDDSENFFRLWTGKEAVVKAIGKGVKALSLCRLISVLSATSLVLQLHDQRWTVSHLFIDAHVAAVARHSGASVLWVCLRTS